MELNLRPVRLLLERVNTISELGDELHSYISKPKSISLRELFESPAYRKTELIPSKFSMKLYVILQRISLMIGF